MELRKDFQEGIRNPEILQEVDEKEGFYVKVKELVQEGKSLTWVKKYIQGAFFKHNYDQVLADDDYYNQTFQEVLEILKTPQDQRTEEEKTVLSEVIDKGGKRSDKINDKFRDQANQVVEEERDQGKIPLSEKKQKEYFKKINQGDHTFTKLWHLDQGPLFSWYNVSEGGLGYILGDQRKEELVKQIEVFSTENNLVITNLQFEDQEGNIQTPQNIRFASDILEVIKILHDLEKAGYQDPIILAIDDIHTALPSSYSSNNTNKGIEYLISNFGKLNITGIFTAPRVDLIPDILRYQTDLYTIADRSISNKYIKNIDEGHQVKGISPFEPMIELGDRPYRISFYFPQAEGKVRTYKEGELKEVDIKEFSMDLFDPIGYFEYQGKMNLLHRTFRKRIKTWEYYQRPFWSRKDFPIHITDSVPFDFNGYQGKAFDEWIREFIRKVLSGSREKRAERISNFLGGQDQESDQDSDKSNLDIVEENFRRICNQDQDYNGEGWPTQGDQEITPKVMSERWEVSRSSAQYRMNKVRKALKS